MSGSGSDNEEEYIVEKIIDKKIGAGGKVLYYLKWKGYGEEENSWEPEDNLECPELIAEFEEKLKKQEKQPEKKKEKSVSKNKSTDTPNDEKKKKRKTSESENSESKLEAAKLSGFDRGLKPERIIGATDSSGELMFLMKWFDTDEADLVRSAEARQKCPQLIIEFYEKHLTWNTQTN